MDLPLILNLLAIFVLLIFSGLFSGSETSMTGVSRARMHTLAQQGNKRAEEVNALSLMKERMIGAILIGNNLVNILASALATSALIQIFGDAGVVYATLGMTALVVIFAEVAPKTYALRNPDRTALAVAPVMRVVTAVFGPPAAAVQVVVNGALSLIGGRAGRHSEQEDYEEELRGAIELHEGEDEEIMHERQMLRSILDLDSVEVSEIMTHRRNVNTVDVEQDPDVILDQVLASPHTRLPLWKGDSDNIVGVLHAKALLRAVQASKGDMSEINVQEIANPPWFIPDTTDLLSQLHAFRLRQEHFAIVVDEYGEVLGVVTLEDILEEIVGDIEDEHDVAVEGVEPLSDGTVVVNGEVTIRDLNRKFEWRLPDEEASTIAGLVLYEARRIPETGQFFFFHGFRFEILGRQGNRITLMKMQKLDDTAEGEESEEKSA